MTIRAFPLALCAALLLGAFASTSHAQSGAALTEKPWQSNDTQYEIDGEASWFDTADIDGTAQDLDLLRYDSAGRVRRAIGDDQELSFGYDALYLDLDTADAALPERLVDVSGSMGWSRRFDEGRRFAIVGGMGYAGNTPFAEGDAVYFLGDLIYDMPLDRKSKLTFTLNYNGNRTIWPDIPLPLVSYSRRVSDELRYTIGVPFSTVVWQPTDRFTLTGFLTPALNLDVRADYELADQWTVFGQLDNRTSAFVVDGNEDRRLFFEQRRLEGGVRYDASDKVELVLAGGYAFSQDFERGWDVRDTSNVRDVDDTPYLRASVRFAF